MTPEESNLSELLEFAENLADTAEFPVLSHFRSKLDIEDKSDSSPVTVADLQPSPGLNRIYLRYPTWNGSGKEPEIPQCQQGFQQIPATQIDWIPQES